VEIRQGGTFMATISGYDSSSLSVLFSSLNNKKTGNGMSDMLGINYSDYATIRSGSYFKLLKSYYNVNASDEVNKIVDGDKDKDNKKTESQKESVSTSTSTSKDSAETISKVKSAADALSAETKNLLATDKSSAFNMVKVTDKEGNVTEKYDTDKIYKAVNDFVSDYNAVVESTSTAKSANITGAADRMMRITGYNKEALGNIGITIEKDGKVKLDETAFKAADVESVKKVFNAESGYAGQIKTQASMITYYAENEAAKANTYSSTGTYNNNYNTGTMYSEGI